MTITINIASLHIHIGDDPAEDLATGPDCGNGWSQAVEDLERKRTQKAIRWTLGITVKDGTIWAGAADEDAERSVAAWEILRDPLRELNDAVDEVTAERLERVVRSRQDELLAIGVGPVKVSAKPGHKLYFDLSE